MTSLEIKKKYLDNIAGLLAHQTPPVQILKQLLKQYVRHLSFFATHVLPFFTAQKPTNVETAKQFITILATKDDPLFVIVEQLNTGISLIQDDFTAILAAFFSLLSKYSSHLTPSIKDKLAIDDIFSTSAHQYFERLVSEKNWSFVLNLDFIPKERVFTPNEIEQLLSHTDKKIILKILAKFPTHFPNEGIPLDKFAELVTQAKLSTQEGIALQTKLSRLIKSPPMENRIPSYSQNNFVYTFSYADISDLQIDKVIQKFIILLQNNSTFSLQKNPQSNDLSSHCYVQQMTSLLHSSKRDLVISKLAERQLYSNRLIFSACTVLRKTLTPAELTKLINKWRFSYSGLFDAVEIAHEAGALIPYIPPKIFTDILDNLSISVCNECHWDFEKAAYELLFQYKEKIAAKKWETVMMRFKKKALIPWGYPGLLERVYQFRDVLPQEAIWSELSQQLQTDALDYIHNLEKLTKLMQIIPVIIPDLIDKVFATPKKRDIDALWLMKNQMSAQQQQNLWQLILPQDPQAIAYHLDFLLDIIDYLLTDTTVNAKLLELAFSRLNWQVVQDQSHQLVSCIERVDNYLIYISDENKKLMAQNTFKNLIQVEEWHLKFKYYKKSLKCLTFLLPYLPMEEHEALFEFSFSLILFLPQTMFSDRRKPVIAFLHKHQDILTPEARLGLAEKWLGMLNGSYRHKYNALYLLENFQSLIPETLHKSIVEIVLPLILNNTESRYEACMALQAYTKSMSYEQKLALLCYFSQEDIGLVPGKMQLFLNVYAGYCQDIHNQNLVNPDLVEQPECHL